MNAARKIHYELSRDRLKSQSDTLRGSTTKAGLMMGFVGIIAATGYMLLPETTVEVALFVLMCLCVILCWGCGLAAIFPRTHWEGPRLSKVKEILASYAVEDALEWITDAQVMTSEHNAHHLSKIAIALFWGLVFLMAAIVTQGALRLFIHFS